MSTHHHLATRVNRVFLDFENVAKIDREVVSRPSVFLTVFFGAQQKKINIETMEAIRANPNQAKIVNVATAGKNALDFVLAHYLGRAVQTNPASCFHIISKDTGYDALVKQLRSEKIRAHRHDSFEGLRPSGQKRTAEATGKNKQAVPEDSVNAAVKILRKCPRARPAKRKTLATFLRSSIGSDLSKQEAQDVIHALCSSGKIKIEEKNLVTYLL